MVAHWRGLLTQCASEVAQDLVRDGVPLTSSSVAILLGRAIVNGKLRLPWRGLVGDEALDRLVSIVAADVVEGVGAYERSDVR